MAKDKLPNHSAVQLIFTAERKLKVIEQELDKNLESRQMAATQLKKVRYACTLLEEVRHVLSAAEPEPDMDQELLPF